MGINDFNELRQNCLASSRKVERERVGNVQEDWHKTDTEPFATRSLREKLKADRRANSGIGRDG